MPTALLNKNELFQSGMTGDNTFSNRLSTMLFLLFKAKRLTPEAQDMWRQVIKILNKINHVIDHPDAEDKKLFLDTPAEAFDIESCKKVKLYEPYKVTQDEMDEYKDCCSGDKAQDRLNKLMRKLENRMNSMCNAACDDEDDLEEDFKDDVADMIEDLMCDSQCSTGVIDFNDGGFEGAGVMDPANAHDSELTDKQHRMRLLHYLYWVLHHVRWRMEHTKYGTSTDSQSIELSTKEDKDAYMVYRLMWKWIQLLDRMSKLAISDYEFSKPVYTDYCFDDDDDSVCCKYPRNDSLENDEDDGVENCTERKSDLLTSTLQAILEKVVEN